MDQKNRKGSLSLSAQDHASTGKRRKLKPAGSLSPPPYDYNSGRANQICREMSDRLEEMRNILENQAAVDRQTIKDLQSNLKEARASARKLHEEKIEISNKNIEMRRRDIDLWNRNAVLGNNLASMTQKAAEEKLKRDAAEKSVELQKIEIRKSNDKIEELTLQRTSLWGDIQRLLSKAARVDHLEEEVKSLRNTASHQKKQVEDLKQQVTSLEGKCEELSLKVQEFEPLKSQVTFATLKEDHYHLIQEKCLLNSDHEVLSDGKSEFGHIHTVGSQTARNDWRKVRESSSDEDETSSSSDGTDDNPDETAESAAETEYQQRDLKIWMGSYYVLVSDRRYFELDWEKELEYLGDRIARCKTCSYRTQTEYVKDHVWCQHYEGKFLCAYCSNSGVVYAWRNNLRPHMTRDHASVFHLPK